LPRQGRIAIARDAAARAGFYTKKKLGQHLLRDPSVVRQTIDALAATPQHALLEIGPGLGALTEGLLKLDLPLLAIEVDEAACAALQERFGSLAHFHLLQADVLKADIAAEMAKMAPGKALLIAANLPYYITTPILARLLEKGPAFERLVTLTQWEVASRLAAKPGSKDYAAISVMAQARCKVQVLRKVEPGAFTPPPKVDSGLILFERLPSAAISEADAPWFSKVTRAAFGKRRKTLRNALRQSGLGLPDDQIDQGLGLAGIVGERRGETLSVQEFAALSLALKPAQGA